VTVTLTS